MYENILQEKLYWYQAFVERVVDGDTLELMLDVGLSVHVKERVRLFGVDTPEVYGVKKDSEEYAAGMKASARTKELVEGKSVWVSTVKDKKGKYGRYLAHVYVAVEGQEELLCLNQTLIDEGLAEAKTY